MKLLWGVWTHRFMVASLVRRQWQLRYRQSAIGLFWAILPPLATLGVGTLLFQAVLQVRTGGANYPVFAMAALVPWTLFANSITLGVPSVVASLGIITRLSFPRAVIPLSMVGLAFTDFAVASVGFVVIVILTGSAIPSTAIWVPVLLAIEIPLVSGLTLWWSAVNVFARDVRLAVPLLIQLWLFVTPVLYPLSAVPDRVAAIYMANPMTGLVESFRRVLVFGQPPTLRLLLPSLIGMAIAMLIGTWYFGATERRFADVI
jgi:lipopolysaccharide transport system permease protein